MILIQEKNRQLVKRYLRGRENRGYTPKTIKDYGMRLDLFLRFLRNKDVTKVDREDIEKFLDSLRNKPSSKKKIKLYTIKVYLKGVSVFLSWLEDNDLILKNPARIIVKEIRVEKTKRRALSLEETRKLVKNAKNPRDKAIILTMAIAGLRLSEVSNLKIGDINLDTFEIFVRQGKGRKDRIIMIDGELIEALNVWLIYRESMNPDTDALFTDLCGKRPLSSIRIHNVVKETAKKAGLKNVYPHRLRHSAATFMHDSGMDILEIKEQLGHTDIKTTEGYIDANEKKRKQGMSRMPSLNVLG